MCKSSFSQSIDIPIDYKNNANNYIGKVIDYMGEGALFCAHPTADYKSVTLNEVSFEYIKEEILTSITYTINYQCRPDRIPFALTEPRPCSIKLQTDILNGYYSKTVVLSDTAFTPAEIGLEVCSKLATIILDFPKQKINTSPIKEEYVYIAPQSDPPQASLNNPKKIKKEILI